MPGEAALREGTRLRESEQGAAIVEFALVVPVLITVYFGVVVTTAGFDLNRKVTLAARAAADLTARAQTMTCADVTSNVGAAATILQPYSAAGLTVSLANVVVTNTGTSGSPNLQARVQWSQARKVANASGAQTQASLPAGWALNSIVQPIPSGFAVAGTSFVMAKVDHSYSPALATNLLGTVNLSQSFNWPARNATPSSWSGTTSCA